MRTPLLLASLMLGTTAMAGTPPTPAMLENLSSTPAGFEENKGQVRTTEGEPAPYVRYRLSQGNTQLFLLENGIAYQFSRLHHPQRSQEAAPHERPDRVGAKQMGGDLRLETYRMDMVLEGADPNSRITTEGRSDDYTQYYNHDALDVRSYTKVTYHEIYPGIDWVVYTTAKGMKYDFVVRPGADPDQIRMRFIHHEELSLDAEGNLIHGNRMGRFTEERPVSFQDGNKVATSFVLEGNALRFALENYDRNRTLVIDPARLWATYYGGEGEDFGWSCTTDASGNVYMAGSAASSNGIAAGGHQNTYADFGDAFLVKFTATGTRLWGTYYGGPGGDSGFQCAVDANGNVFLSGETNSSTGIASGGHQNAIGGDNDAFLVKFNAAGTRLWATYYGGTGYDRSLHCDVEASGNVFLCGEASSSSAIASGGHQNTYGGGDRDGFLVKFSPTGTRLWGTYYGGNDYDTGQSCIVDPSGYVIISGQTTSTASIASGGHQNTIGGGFDAFLAKFHSGGALVWASYYGGSGGDNGWQCAVSTDGSVFLAGSTSSTTGIASGGHQNAYGGGVSDGFIAKFNADGTREWSSYYGGSNEDFAYSCAVDAAGSAYLTGFTSSTTDIASNGHQNTYGGGGSDAFLTKFGPSGDRSWGTYYGGEGFEGGFWEPTYFVSGRCALQSNGSVILTGVTTSLNGISLNGHQNSFAGDHDGFLVKFEDRSIITGLINGPLCTGQAVNVPFTVSGAFNAGNTFTAQLSSASGSFASPMVIGTLSGTTNGIISASIPIGTAPGTGYRIRVVGSNPVVEGSDNGTNLTINNPTTNCTCADVTEIEANNTAAAANALTYDTPSSGITGPCSLPDNTPDVFSFATSAQGLLRVEACLSNTGPVDLDVTFRVLNSSGGTLGTFVLPAGANNAALTGEFLFPCRGITSYRIAVDNPSTTVCTNYALSYTILDPVFGNDPEPNDGVGVNATPVAYNTDRDGRNNFDLETTYDYYSITLPSNGVLNLEIQAEHAGATPGTMAVALLSNGGTVIQTWSTAVGANGVPVTTNASITCRSTVSTYHIRINSAACGTSYRFKYTVTTPLFASDTEPNNTQPGLSLAHDTYQEGHLQFDGENANDIYRILPPTNGVMSFEVQAEHVGATNGTMTLDLLSTTGAVVGTWNVPVGASSTPITSTMSITCRSIAGYDVRLSSATCGTSYKFKYTMTAPLFATDAEPNNNTPGSPLAHDTYTEGQVQFDGDTYDHYRILPPTNGVMTFEVQAEHVGATNGTMTLDLLSTTGAVVGTWSVQVGANSTPITSTMSITCRSIIGYDVRLSAATCGVSYRWKYMMAAPHFANDLEPNNTTPGTPLAHETYTEGHVQFDGDAMDHFNIVPPSNGVMTFEVEAEHVGATTGTMKLRLLSSTGATIQFWSIPVGANGIPTTTTVSTPCRSIVSPYNVRLSATTCGVSYRFNYTMTAPFFATDVEPNNAAPGTPLAHSTYTEGHLQFDAESTYDFYRIVPSANGMVNIEVQAEHTGATPGNIQLVMLSGVTTLQTWNIPIGPNGVPVTTTVSITCRTGGTNYDLRLSTTTCGTSYKMKWTLTPPAFTTDTEPNNTTAQALILPETQTAQGHLNFSSDNLDLYRVNTSGQGILNVLIEAEHAGPGTTATVTIQLLNSGGTVIQTWTAPVGAGSIPLSTVFSRTCTGNTAAYYLRISSITCLTSYRVSYTVTPPAFGNDVEPNQSTSAAQLATAGMDTDGHLSFDYDNNYDYFRIQAPNDGVLSVSLLAEHAGATPGTMSFYLRNHNGTTLQLWTVNVGANGVPASNVVTYSCIGTENVYYLEVYAPSVCGVSYRLNYTMIAPLFADDTEPNQSTAQALLANANTDYDGHLDFYNDNNYDYFRIQVPNDGVLSVTILAENAGATPGTMSFYLRNHNGTTLQLWTVNVGANGVPASNVVTYSCIGTENVYYLEPYSPSVCGVSYRFNYTMIAPLFADDTEPNQSTAQALVANANTDYDGHLDFYNDNNYDYFRIQPPNDGVLSVNLLAEHVGGTPGTMSFYLRNHNGTVLQQWTVNVGANGVPASNVVTYSCIGTENVYYLEPYSPSVCGVSYRFNYTMIAPLFADDTEPNQSTAQAMNIDLNAAPAFGRLAFYNDNGNDYFRIVHPGGPINVYTLAERAGAAGTMSVYIRNINGTVQLTNSSVLVGGNSTPALDTTTLASAAAGTYYIELYSPSFCGVSYQLKCYDDDGDGTCNGLDLCAGGPEPGTPCDDNDPLTINDVIGANCQCVGTTVNCIVNGDCDDNDPCTLDECDGNVCTFTPLPDGDGDGICDATDGCPNDPNKIAPGVCGCGEPEPGTTCDDGDPTTTGDVVTANCECLGTPTTSWDCEDLQANFGSPCDDGDACTTSDVIQLDCTCAGVFTDNDGDGTCDAQDLCPGGPEPGTPCNDNNNATIDDIIQPDCTCAGTLLDNDCLGEPGGPALPGTPCDDNSACTVDDVYQANCDCAGTPVNTDDDDACTIDSCDPILGVIHTPVDPDDGNPCTLDSCDPITGVSNIFQDMDSDGTCDAQDGCPNDPDKTAPGNCGCGNPEPGATCDDGDNNTINDVIGANCLCAGTLLDNDCLGEPGGPALPGTPCDDNSACTVDDVYQANCDCAGTPVSTDDDNACTIDSCDPILGVMHTPIDPDDGDPCTLDSCDPITGVSHIFQDMDSDGTCDAQDGCPEDPNKTAPGNCGCGVSDVDTDSDGTSDCNDGCPADPNKTAPGSCGCGNPEPGTACDDGNANTENDLVGANCLCAGTPIGGGCTTNELDLEITTDGVSTTLWEVRAQGTNMLVASGGQLYQAGVFNESICLTDGCFYLKVTDDGGDGITGGGYILRTTAPGRRVIDNRNNFHSGFTSQIANNGSFCLPMGNDRLITASCDQLQLRRGVYGSCNDRLTADNTPNNTSGNVYQFWFYDPNGTLSLVYPSANGGTSNQVNMASLPTLVEGRLYNVRVRTRISPGIWRSWGPACRMKIDNTAGQCPSTSLQDEVNNSHLTCGQTKSLGNGQQNLVFAKPKSRFTPSCGCRTRTSTSSASAYPPRAC
ncbi:MAG: hypothetical protein IPL52_18160 [Flavobacteriales bacterium]|nr:hypothetical protein [Flavobacteriales bacterium]